MFSGLSSSISHSTLVPVPLAGNRHSCRIETPFQPGQQLPFSHSQTGERLIRINAC
jgi:hypothetical protein